MLIVCLELTVNEFHHKLLHNAHGVVCRLLSRCRRKWPHMSVMKMATMHMIRDTSNINDGHTTVVMT